MIGPEGIICSNGDRNMEFNCGIASGMILVITFFSFIWLAMVAAGIYLIVSSVRKKKKRTARFGVVFLAIAIGLPTLYLALAIGQANNCSASCRENGISEKTIIGGIFAAVGAVGLIARFLASRRFAKKFTTPVEGTFLGFEDGCPRFQFILYGTERIVKREMSPRYYHPEVGEVRTLYIDENDLSDYYDPRTDKGNRIGLSIFLYVLFAHLLAIGLLILFL